MAEQLTTEDMLFLFGEGEDSFNGDGAVDSEDCRAASKLVSGSMLWSQTREGHDFWAYVKKRLREIGEHN